MDKLYINNNETNFLTYVLQNPSLDIKDNDIE